MESDLGHIFWQFMVLGLIIASGFAAFWGAKRYRRWYRQRFGEAQRWGMVSSLAVGVALFFLFAVIFGFVIDQARAF